jgi:phosphoglycolate phosphatase-like HAD superfamily hydrolase
LVPDRTAGFRAVLLDVDGTLIDSNDAHARAWVDVGAELGYDIRFEEVRPLIGMGGDKVLPRLTGLEEESAAGRRVTARRGEIFLERYLPSLHAFPGARELLLRMRSAGLRRVVASSAGRDELDALLERAGLADLVDASTSSSDADASKPAPDIVEAALEQAGCGPDGAVMLGDTPYDVEAALRAGVAIVALRCGGWDREALRGAASVYADPRELLACWDDSILGGR